MLIKTHAWSGAFDLRRASHGALAGCLLGNVHACCGAWLLQQPQTNMHLQCPCLPLAVFVTHRDLRQVLASFRRMTW